MAVTTKPPRPPLPCNENWGRGRVEKPEKRKGVKPSPLETPYRGSACKSQAIDEVGFWPPSSSTHHPQYRSMQIPQEKHETCQEGRVCVMCHHV